MIINWKKMRKALVAFVSFVAVATGVALDLGDIVPTDYVRWAILIVTLANVFGVYRVPNEKPTEPVVEGGSDGALPLF